MSKLISTLLLTLSLPINAAVISVASNSNYNQDSAVMDAALGLTGFTIENFENVNLVSGLSIEYLNPNNGPVTTLSQTYTDGSGVFSNNNWDGNRALINTFDNDIWFGGPNGDVRQKISQRITFNVGSVDFFGIGLGNFQADLADHALLINGVEVVSALEDMSNFTSGINIRNGYLMILADSTEKIQSVGFELRFNGTSNPISDGLQSDGLIFDHLAFGNVQAVPIPPSLFLFLSGLFGIFLSGFMKHHKRI